MLIILQESGGMKDDEILKFIDENISVEDAHDVLDSLQWM